MRKLKTEKTDILSRLLKSLITNPNKYLLIILILILCIPLAYNLASHKPAIMEEESYYHLSQAKNIDYSNFYYLFLGLIINFLPEGALMVLIYAFCILSVVMLSRILQKIKKPYYFSFFFLLFLLLSPSTIFNFITLSANAFFLFLVLSVFMLALSRNEKLHKYSLFPLIAATFIDVVSTLILMILIYLLLYLKKEKPAKLYLILIGISLLFNLLILKQPFFLGPFHQQNWLSAMISDLGGISGISFFVIILAFIGIKSVWKTKDLRFNFLFLLLFAGIYIYNTRAVFLLAFPLILLAASGFSALLEKAMKSSKDSKSILKKFTLLLILLGIFFSATAYLSRINDFSPTNEEKEALVWVKENTDADAIIYSTPDNSQQINYLAERRAFASFRDKESREISEKILSSTYIQELFPLLEENNISLLYLTKDITEKLPKDQGLIFLLKNEKFKLIYSTNQTEVWEFNS